MTSEKQPVSLWERLEGTGRTSRASLTHGQIATAAIAIADRDGLAAVSMRRLADELGVSTMAVYRYVSAKVDIFELMCDALAAMTLPHGDGATWRTVMTSLAEQIRATALVHPWLIQLTTQYPHFLTPNMLATAEQALTAMNDLDIDDDTAMAIISSVRAFTQGLTAAEAAQRQFLRRTGQDDTGDPRMVYQSQADWVLRNDRYPMVTRYMLEGSNADDPQWQFEFGLTCLLDGFAARLGEPRKPTR